MLLFEGARTVSGLPFNLNLPGCQDEVIDASHLTVLPAVIDPHVHFRVPGMEHKEDWRTGAKAAIRGGCTTVFDMPNTIPPTVTLERLEEKKSIIDAQLQECGIPLRYQLFFGADKFHLNEIPRVRQEAIGIKVFMGCSTGNLVIDDDESLHQVFEVAAKQNMLVAVHAEDEALIKKRKLSYDGEMCYHIHSHIRNIEVATRAVEKAISLSKKYGTTLYVLHVSSIEEIELIKNAKLLGLPVYAETTPHHLFFDVSAYDKLGGKAVVNPPLREHKHQVALMQAIRDGIIDTIGSDHAPHTQEEKNLPYGQCPSGMPGIEFVLPLLLNASHHGLIDLEKIVSLTSVRAKEIFNLSPFEDYVLVDMNKKNHVNDTMSKCQWSPYFNMTLKGWPVYTILKNQCYAHLT